MTISTRIRAAPTRIAAPGERRRSFPSRVPPRSRTPSSGNGNRATSAGIAAESDCENDFLKISAAMAIQKSGVRLVNMPVEQLQSPPLVGGLCGGDLSEILMKKVLIAP